MKLKLLLLLCLVVNYKTFANDSHAESKPVGEKSEKSQTESEDKESAILDFSSIKDIIKKDGLEVELKKKNEVKRKLIDDKKRLEIKKFNIPTENEFWSLFSELYLVKNATKLKWDFHKPDFELEKAFSTLLEAQGIYEKKFKILLLDTPEIAHAALPSNPDEIIFVLSLPFIRILDLSKVEISMLLFEDYIRYQKGYFKNYVTSKELEAYLGSNFNGKTLDKKLLDDHMKKYNVVLYEKGFSFQEQFEVTKELDTLFKNDLKMWNTYFTLIQKIDGLVKTNTLYKNYAAVYPSPELQINWLRPKVSPL